MNCPTELKSEVADQQAKQKSDDSAKRAHRALECDGKLYDETHEPDGRRRKRRFIE